MTTLQGDLVFYKVTPRGSLLARLIGAGELLAGEGSGPVMYYHVALIVDGDEIVEATWPRVRRSRFNPTDPSAEVMRVSGAPAAAREVAVRTALESVGDWYNPLDFFTAAFRSRRGEICSRLVKDAWAAAGVDLYPDAGSVVSPNELAESRNLERVVA